MSVQFGKWNFEGQAPTVDYIEKVSATLTPYGPDSNEAYSKGGVKILYRAFHTTKESRLERQPHISPSGTVITWDGRLDNRAELVSEVRDSLTISSTDIAIVATVYEKWGNNCLAKLIGDWALSIWNPINRSLILAKDPIGTHHLYYSIEKDDVTWSTVLDPLILFAGKTFSISEEYIAGWFSYFPAAHLTPYVGIHSVPPSSFVLLRRGKHTVCKYWDFDPTRKTRYRTDGEYEEHFRTVFATAVQRRLRSDRPVLAELSGGLDSSSIVCMADTVIGRGAAETSALDTISWYDDSYDHIEPDTNERRFFTKVEEKRGRAGCQINLASLKNNAYSHESFGSEFNNHRFAAIPSANRELSELLKHYAAHMLSHGHRVTLSGIGGDEVTCGGVPTPTPELQNLLAGACFPALIHRLNAWAVKMRKPHLLLLSTAVHGFLFPTLTGVSKDMKPAPWLDPDFRHRNYAALSGYPSRIKLFGPMPSFQENVAILNVLRRLLASWPLHPELLREIRFPYLDRDFLEFIYAVPRQQLVDVGKRRFLMKRALVGIVPDELLNRRRKRFVPQRTKTDSSTEWTCFAEVDKHMLTGAAGIINQSRFEEALERTRANRDVPAGILRDTVTLESWLRHLTSHRCLNALDTHKKKGFSAAAETEETSGAAEARESS
jgi:asparagine synthase (glutamine-hydrolysing)